MDEKERKIKRIKYLVFHRASSQMEELLRGAVERLNLHALPEEDLNAIYEVVSLYDRDLEEIIYGRRKAEGQIRRGLEILGLL